MGTKKFGILSIASLLVLLVIGLESNAYSQTEDEKSATNFAEMGLVWMSSAAAKNAMASEYNEFYSGIAELKSKGWEIPTKTIKRKPEDKSVTALLRRNNYFHGTYFPANLNQIVCDLNPQFCNTSCSRSKDGSRGWCEPPEAEITVPLLNMTSRVLISTYAKKSGDRIENIVVHDRDGCTTFDNACREVIVNLNGGESEVLEPSYAGTIVVPTKFYNAEFDIFVPVGRARFVDVKDESGAVENVLDLTDQGVNELLSAFGRAANNIYLLGLSPTLELQSSNCSDEAVSIDRNTLFELINHPQSTGINLPLASNFVALVDSWVDLNHCDLSVLNKDANGSIPGGDFEESETCGSEGEVESKDTDHGTHLAGLISTKDGAQYPGVSSVAKLYAQAISPKKFVVEPEGLENVAMAMWSLLRREHFSVTNLSWSYPRLGQARTNIEDFNAKPNKHDSIERVIEPARKVLFVVAAGNQGLPVSFKSSCEFKPACHRYPNLISVVASSWDGQSHKQLDCSNYGHGFDIIAPGNKIVSSLPGNKIGEMSGTSQAAAVVSGVASLVSSSCRLSPKNIRRRMIMTSDYYASLGDIAYGGIVNASKAIQTQVDQLTYISEDGSESTVTGVDLDKPSKEVQVTLYDAVQPGKSTSNDITVRMARIDRLTRVNGSPDSAPEYVMFVRNETFEEQAEGISPDYDVDFARNVRRFWGSGISLSAPLSFELGTPAPPAADTVEIPTTEPKRLIDFVRGIDGETCS